MPQPTNPNPAKVTTVVVHCSDSYFGNAALIASWHLQRGWSGIGYHYVILNGHLTSKIFNPKFNGHLETGRPLDDDPLVSKIERGAHVKGHNTGSVGICLIGESGQFTGQQFKTLLELIKDLKDQYGLIRVVQHSDLDKKKPFCAGIDPDQLAAAVAHIIDDKSLWD